MSFIYTDAKLLNKNDAISKNGKIRLLQILYSIKSMGKLAKVVTLKF